MHFTEDMFEQAVIELFKHMGYTHIYAPDILQSSMRMRLTPLSVSAKCGNLGFLNRGLRKTYAVQVNKLQD